MKKNNFKFNKTNFLLATSLLLPLATNINPVYAESADETTEEVINEEVQVEEEISGDEGTERTDEIDEKESQTQVEVEEGTEEEIEEESKVEDRQENAAAVAAIAPASHQPAFTYEFIEELAPDAVELGRKYGIYPSIMIAQAALETGWGGQGAGVRDDYILGLAPNYNLFGIKGSYRGESVVVPTTEELPNGETITTEATFKKYPSYRASMEDYANKLRFNRETVSWNPYLYQDTWVENSEHYIKALDGLKSWATSSSYREQLKGLIENYSLAQYDDEAFSGEKNAADKEYERVTQLTDAHEKWTATQQFETNYPEDLRLETILNSAAYDLVKEIIVDHETHTQAENISYLEAIINEERILSHIQTQAALIQEKIRGDEEFLSADAYYEKAMSAYGVSDAWEASKEMKELYPNDRRLTEVIQRVAERNLIQGKRVHNSGDYVSAVNYYDRVLVEDRIDADMRKEVQSLRKFAENNQAIISADVFYQEAMTAYGVSDAWEASKDMKFYYPNDQRLTKALNRVAERNFIQGNRVHDQGNFSGAVEYYDRVLAEELVVKELQKQAASLREVALAEEIIRTADQYYNEAMTAYGVSDAWEASKAMKKYYPADSRLEAVINRVAERNFIQGRRVHDQGNFSGAVEYYNRVLDERMVSARLHNTTKSLKSLARANQKRKSADHYYKEAMTAYGVSDAWQASQTLAYLYPNDSRLSKVMNRVADRNLIQGQRVHENQQFNEAISYYDRVLDADQVQKSTKDRAAQLKEMAQNKEMFVSANDLYEAATTDENLTEAWNAVESMKEYYPNDKRLSETVNHVAERSLLQGRQAHEVKKYQTAVRHYERILSEKLVDSSVQELTSKLLKQAEKNERHLIYVDPGHGGNQAGAVVGGITEKALNLKVSSYLTDELESRGYFVASSRVIDERIELADRAKEANRLGADIFVSVHHNSGGGSSATGIETFIYHRVANGFGQETDRRKFNVDDPRIKASLNLADFVHNNLIADTGLRDRGVKGNNFAVLRQTEIPAILVELGFMDNPEELSIIKTEAYQRKAAQSMANGIERYYQNK